MKKTFLILVICLSACSVSKPVITDSSAFKNHPQPYNIFGVGNWKPGYSVLTLVDANAHYFVIITRTNNELIKGNTFNPTE